MARILVGTVPVIGHINPLLPIARALVERGHDVAWLTGAKYRARIEATGARWLPTRYAPDYDDAHIDERFPDGKDLRGLARLKFGLKTFVDCGLGQLVDLERVQRYFGADLLLSDPAFIGGFFFRERAGLPQAVLNLVPMLLSSRDTAPWGLGLPPSATFLGRLRNRALNWAVPNLLFRDVQRHWNRTRDLVGLPPAGWLLDEPARATLNLQPTVPSFEYPRSDLPPNVHFIGAPAVEAPAGWEPPDGWERLDGSRPVVHVTQGTIANETPDLIRPALEGLAGEDVLVVVSTGGRPPAELGLVRPPENACIYTFLSYPDLLPRTDVMVTNGGYGGVQAALAHGVPLVVAGTTEDKPEVAARVAWSGAGINLETAAPTPARVRDAVRRILRDERYRARARFLQAEHARHDAVARAAELLETLVPPARAARVAQAMRQSRAGRARVERWRGAP